MKRSLIILFSLLLTSQLTHAQECLLSGKWKANKEKTIESIAKSKALNKEQKEFFIKNTTGNSIIENTCKDFTMHINDKVFNVKLLNLKEEGNTAITEYYSNTAKRIISRKSILLGECYYVENGYGFNEYYCKNN